MLKRILPVLIALAVLLTACGPKGTPTMSPADVQGTAVSAAWTMVAMTQLAIPTATLMPPTETPSPTPLPTFTPQALFSTPSTLGILPTSTSASDEDNCLMPLDIAEAGPTRRVRVENISGGSLNLSLTMYNKNAFGQCGALSYAGVGKNGKFIVELPVGSWFAYAWITLKSGSSESSGSFQIPKGGDDMLRLLVNKDTILLKGP